jgi:hypothetical protein
VAPDINQRGSVLLRVILVRVLQQELVTDVVATLQLAKHRRGASNVVNAVKASPPTWIESNWSHVGMYCVYSVLLNHTHSGVASSINVLSVAAATRLPTTTGIFLLRMDLAEF